MYKIILKILFLFDAELAHHMGLLGLKLLYKCRLQRFLTPKIAAKPVKMMNIDFPNPVGLAGGLDKNGDYIDALAALGFGFLELGTVTPRPQRGNPKPRLFRLIPAKAIINRMGFNNKGIDYLISRVKESKFEGVIGINIGKNFATPVAAAVDDYLFCFRKAYTFADYIAINISSPNTKNLRDLQEKDELQHLLSALKNEQKKLSDSSGRYVPIAVKIAPDLSDNEIQNIAQIVKSSAIDAVIATNTTITREELAGLKHAAETGGLSGLPLRRRATEVVKKLTVELRDAVPVIGVGGIFSAEDAAEKFAAGAKLVQICTGFIYRGPQLIKEIADFQQR